MVYDHSVVVGRTVDVCLHSGYRLGANCWDGGRRNGSIKRILHCGDGASDDTSGGRMVAADFVDDRIHHPTQDVSSDTRKTCDAALGADWGRGIKHVPPSRAYRDYVLHIAGDGIVCGSAIVVGVAAESTGMADMGDNGADADWYGGDWVCYRHGSIFAEFAGSK